MGTVTVALPAKLKDWLDEQLEVGEINDASSYVSELVAQDRVRRNAERLQALRNRVEIACKRYQPADDGRDFRKSDKPRQRARRLP